MGDDSGKTEDDNGGVCNAESYQSMQAEEGEVLERIHELRAELGRLRRTTAAKAEASGFEGIARGTAEVGCGTAVVQGLQSVDFLEDLVTQLRCGSVEELPRAVASLLRLCDERLAAQRVIDALRRLFRVDGLTEVLPALKRVLDVRALRRLQAEAGSAAGDVASGDSGS